MGLGISDQKQFYRYKVKDLKSLPAKENILI